MSRQIVKQPNGLYCLYSSIIENVICCNMTSEEVVYFLLKEKESDMSFDEMMGKVKDRHGEIEYELLKRDTQ